VHRAAGRADGDQHRNTDEHGDRDGDAYAVRGSTPGVPHANAERADAAGVHADSHADGNRSSDRDDAGRGHDAGGDSDAARRRPGRHRANPA
jgi:hypothetical protein